MRYTPSPPYMNESPIRILFVGGALCGGGAERQLFQLATALHAISHQVTVAKSAQSDLATEFRHVPLRTSNRRSNVGAICGIAGALVRLCRLCMNESPDVIVGWHTVPLIIASAVGKDCRTPFGVRVRSNCLGSIGLDFNAPCFA
jgi:hypothetical protein